LTGFPVNMQIASRNTIDFFILLTLVHYQI
jgi:hypothetical protein